MAMGLAYFLIELWSIDGIFALSQIQGFVQKKFIMILLLFACLQIKVPKPLVGMVIGRKGDMIKNIQLETGAKVQFKEGTRPRIHAECLL